MYFSASSSSRALLLRKVRGEGASPGEGWHAAPRFGTIGAVAGILPGVGIPMMIVEDRCRGEADCVCAVSGRSEALWQHCTVGSLVLPRQAISSDG